MTPPERRRDLVALPRVELRCPKCNLRLADYANGVQAGIAVVIVKCRKCGEATNITLAPQ